MLGHTMQSLLLGTFPIGISALISMTVFVCVPRAIVLDNKLNNLVRSLPLYSIQNVCLPVSLTFPRSLPDLGGRSRHLTADAKKALVP